MRFKTRTCVSRTTGDYEGRWTDEIRGERPDWSLLRDGVPGGETIEEVRAVHTASSATSATPYCILRANGASDVCCRPALQN